MSDSAALFTVDVMDSWLIDVPILSLEILAYPEAKTRWKVLISFVTLRASVVDRELSKLFEY